MIMIIYEHAQFDYTYLINYLLQKQKVFCIKQKNHQ